MIPEPGVIASNINIKRLVAVRVQQAGRLNAVGHVAADLLKVFVGERADVPILRHRLGREPDLYWEVVPDCLVDGFDDLARESQPVFEGTAVLVGAMVELLGGELVQKVALVACMHLDPVKPGLIGHFCSDAELGDDLVDLVGGDLATSDVWIPLIGDF